MGEYLDPKGLIFESQLDLLLRFIITIVDILACYYRANCISNQYKLQHYDSTIDNVLDCEDCKESWSTKEQVCNLVDRFMLVGCQVFYFEMHQGGKVRKCAEHCE